MKKTTASMLAGVFLGATLLSGAQAAVETYAAQRSAQRIYVDGKPVQIEAYSINGNNYAKIRDLGKAVGFNVSYDTATNTVRIDSDTPYQDDAAEPQGSRIVTIPQSDENFVLKVGGLVRCDDGTLYEIKDMSRYDTMRVHSRRCRRSPATGVCSHSPSFPRLRSNTFSTSTATTCL